MLSDFQTSNVLRRVHLLPEVVLIIEGLALLIPIDHFACGRGHRDPINLKLPSSFPGLLLQVHLLDILLRHRHPGQDLDEYIRSVVASSRRGVDLADKNVPNWSFGQSFLFSATVIIFIVMMRMRMIIF